MDQVLVRIGNMVFVCESSVAAVAVIDKKAGSQIVTTLYSPTERPQCQSRAQACGENKRAKGGLKMWSVLGTIALFVVSGRRFAALFATRTTSWYRASCIGGT